MLAPLEGKPGHNHGRLVIAMSLLFIFSFLSLVLLRDDLKERRLVANLLAGVNLELPALPLLYPSAKMTGVGHQA